MARFLVVMPLRHDPRDRSHGGVPDGPGGNAGNLLPRPARCGPGTLPGIITWFRLTLLGGAPPGRCQVRPFPKENPVPPCPERHFATNLPGPAAEPLTAWEGSGAHPGVAGAVGVDVKRARGRLHHLFGDHHLLDAFEAGQVEHGVEQDT